MTATLPPATNGDARAKLLEERRTGIGGSDAAAALGISKWRTPLELFLEKTGQLPKDESEQHREDFYWGLKHEPLIAEEYELRTDTKVRRRQKAIRNRKFPFALAHVDRVVVGGRIVVELKNPSEWARGWGAPGTDEIPVDYLAQCHHYLTVGEFERCDVAVLRGGNRFAIYRVHPSDIAADRLMKGESEFWNDHVLAKEPPEPRSLDDCRLMWAQSLPSSIVATDETYKACMRIGELKASLKAAKRELEREQFAVEEFMGEHETLYAPDGKERLATLKTSKVFNAERFGLVHPDLYTWHCRFELDLKSLGRAEKKLYSQFKTLRGSKRFLLKI